MLAALRQDPDRLKKAAEKAWDKAIEGDLAAFKEIADRLDGKSVQPIAGDDDNPLTLIHRIERVIIDDHAANKDT